MLPLKRVLRKSTVGWLVLVCLSLAVASLHAGGSSAPRADEPQSLAVTAKDGTELKVSAYPGASGRVVIWLPSRAGIVANEHEIAARLAKKGPNVWVVDLLADRFLNMTRSGLAAIPAGDVTAVVQAAAERELDPVLLAGGHGAAVALRGGAAARERDNAAARTILLYPYLYEEIPGMGEEPVFVPDVVHAGGRIVILQPVQSAQVVWIDDVADALREAGAEVTVRHLSGVRDAFQARRTETDADRDGIDQLPGWLMEALETLDE